ncbi:hypothetical protein [Runella slithyformis]|uniref:Uncharacterized protein n=1 Tax=Runella slithyformis (strain ATCC 29530 / DSM 19594 / LMG 11500 / NCIMB 11436 / LSU 4) TaxID=761193 RepID=A0A7U4E654_RUNSL|nr:hypothetical protein [Runella slithyformis]AEI48898.1 hypothetical protein Runsl_2494 [Runella slithyformis DSM 19594]
MNYAKVLLLILFSSLIGLTAIVKPGFAEVKKQLSIEKGADSSGPDSESDCPLDEETNEEDTEGGDEFEPLTCPVFILPILKTSPVNFAYYRLIPDHFTSICLPPPKRG